MITRIQVYFEKKRALRFLEGAQAWYEACTLVTQLCLDALYSEKATGGDIGVLLDKADKKLFTLRNYTSDVHSTVKRSNPALARRVNQITHQIFKLRNDTARFLIRSQGPGPFSAGDSKENELQQIYYYRALEEFGFDARQENEGLADEVQNIWREMQSIIQNAENIIARDIP